MYANLLVYKPPRGVRTPLALLTAEREKDPATGIERAKLPSMLHRPRAIISWEASTTLPPAEMKRLCLIKYIFTETQINEVRVNMVTECIQLVYIKKGSVLQTRTDSALAGVITNKHFDKWAAGHQPIY